MGNKYMGFKKIEQLPSEDAKQKIESGLNEIIGPRVDNETSKHIDETVHDILTIENLLQKKDVFVPGNRFFNQNEGKIEYVPDEMESTMGKLKLLHEYGHKMLGHVGTIRNLEVLENERIAWIYALKAAEKLGITINDKEREAIVESFNTYKQFIERARVCPACGSKNTNEFAPQKYTCGDCYTDW